MANTETKKIDWSKINVRSAHEMSSEAALKDVVPFEWDDDVINGKKKVIIKKDGKSICAK